MLNIKNLKMNVKKTKAFTLLEMTVVMIIIGLLLLLIIPNVSAIREQANNRQAAAMVELVQTQVNLYIAEHGEENSITFDTLKTGKYLSEEQIIRAQKAKINIGDKNVVTRVKD